VRQESAFDERVPTLSSTVVGSGPRLVFVHGFTQTGRSWGPVAQELAKSYEVTTIDLPGHGASANVNAADLDEAGRLVAITGGPGTYVGYSMGGRVALHAAFADPGVVERLVLVGTSPGIHDNDERAARLDSDMSLADRLDGSSNEQLTLDEFLSQWLSQPLFSHLEPSVAGLDARRQNTTAGLARALRTLGTGTQRYDPERLVALEMPVLILAGERDERYVTVGRELAELIGKNARFESLNGVGHAAPFEDPIGFASSIESWLVETQP